MFRIAIVDDHALVRAGLRQFFADQVDFSVVVEAANGRDAMDVVRAAHEQLSERELQVFLRLARDETIGHMAESMSLSVKTVSTYRTRVMAKMGLASNSDLTY